MSQPWLMMIVALVATSVVAEDMASKDYGDEHYLRLVRKKACAGQFCGDADASQPDLPVRNRNEEDHGINTANIKRTCMSWNCKKRSLIARLKTTYKRSKVIGEKRCMSWNCKRRSGKRGSSRSNKGFSGGMKKESMDRLERKDVKRIVQPNKKCITWRCKREMKKPDALTTNVKKEVSQGKRMAAKKEAEAIDTSKRIISRKNDKDLDFLGMSRDGKCRGLNCLTKSMRAFKNPDTLTANEKKEESQGCITWKCSDGKRMTAKKEAEAIDTSKRIISRKNDKDLDFLGMSRDGKCRGLNCLTKRMKELKDPDTLTANDIVQEDIPSSMKCLSWDCYKRKADSEQISETLEKRLRTRTTKEEVKPQFQERDVPQYGTANDYKDMMKTPIRRDAVGRILPAYFTKRSLPRTSQREDFQEERMGEQEREEDPVQRSKDQSNF